MGKEGLYKDGIYTDAGGFRKEPVVAGHFLLAHVVAEVVAHLDHVHLKHQLFHLFKQSDSNPEHCTPSIH